MVCIQHAHASVGMAPGKYSFYKEVGNLSLRVCLNCCSLSLAEMIAIVSRYSLASASLVNSTVNPFVAACFSISSNDTAKNSFLGLTKLTCLSLKC
jgi:hypothetical protein